MTTELRRTLQRSAIIVQRFARQEAPVDRGQLRNSIQIRQLLHSVVITPRAKYALPVHEGSRPHFPPIKALTGKEESLDLWARRRGINPFLLARSIARKGTKPNPFMERAADKATPQVQAEFDALVARLVRDF